MRNILNHTMTLGAVVLTTTALNIRDVFAADDRVHEPAIIIQDDGGFELSHETYDHHAEVDGLP